jgi:1-acyl-sn-glycerol-3-phosphate acyltransferase
MVTSLSTDPDAVGEHRRLYAFVRMTAAVATRLAFGAEAYDVPPLEDLDGGMIVASNHQSFLDPIVLATTMPVQVNFLARSTLFRVPGFGRFISNLGARPVKRGQADARALRTMIQVLRGGGKLVMFPEGTRSRNGRMGRLRPGAAAVACRCKVPILPVYIDGTYEAWSRHAPLPRPARVRAAFGKLIGTEERDADEVTAELETALRERRRYIRSKIAQDDIE